MAMVAGTRLGPYTIGLLLGSGGMGEVYRADDTRLHRVVAIKTLSKQLESSPHAVERFEREARAAAALNHPNICTVYDVGTDPPYIAMELLEGETLQQRLTRGAIDVGDVIDISLALVDALDAAHAKGILHRDIKPGNIFLTERGPKLLDFGLAKAVAKSDAHDATGDVTRPPESVLTDVGVAVGTVAYMSPEQLRSRPLDSRSDLFSFGLVMYEMVTGRPAFAGESSAVIAAAILHEPPMLPRDVRSEVPTRLEEIILETIEKEPRDRTQTAADLRANLRRLKRDLESGSLTARQSDTVTSGAKLKSGEGAKASRRSLLVAAVVIGLMIGGGAYLWSRRAAPVGSLATALLQDAQVSQVTSSGNAWRPSLSPDGKYLIYVQRDGLNRSLRVRQLGTERDIEIVPSEPGVSIATATVTPDGSFVDFLRTKDAATTLWRVPFLGGSATRLMDNVSSAIAWSPDGHRMAFVRADVKGSSALVVANADGTSERTVATRKLPAQFLWFRSRGTPSAQGSGMHPAWSPDGKTLAMIGFESVNGVSIRQVVFLDVADGTERSIPLRDGGAADGVEWLDQNHLVVSQMGQDDAVSQLWVLSYPDGEWSRLTNDLNNFASVAVSADRRTLAVERWDYRVSISVLEDPSGEPVDVVAAAPFMGADLAWAGDKVMYERLSPSNNRPALWAGRQGAANHDQLIVDAFSPASTPDGKTIVFSRVESGARSIWRADAEGRGAVRLANAISGRFAVTPDGKHVIFMSNDKGVQSPWIQPLDGGEPRQLVNQFSYLPAPSRDGKWLAFVSTNQQGQPVLSICALAECASLRSFAVARGPIAVQWTPDGRGVAYATLANIWVQPVDGGAPSQLTRFPEDDYRIEDFEWSPDGKRLAMSRSRTTWDIVLFRGMP